MRSFAGNLAAYFFILILAGCSGALNNLAKLGENRQQTQAYVKQQEELFAKLDVDVRNNNLKTGTLLSQIIAFYGEPILRELGEYKGKPADHLLYRRPLKFFSTELIYLYFDQDQRLVGWEVQPA